MQKRMPFRIARSVARSVANSISRSISYSKQLVGDVLSTSLIKDLVDVEENIATFSRNSTATVVDFEGLMRKCIAGEARFGGVRRVQNLEPDPEYGGPWTSAGGGVTVNNDDTYLGERCVSVTYPTGAQGWGQRAYGGSSAISSGTRITGRFRMAASRNLTGIESLRTFFVTAGGALNLSVDSSDTITAFKDYGLASIAVPSGTVEFTSMVYSGIPLTSPLTVYYLHKQYENITGQASRVTGEFTPSVEYHLTENGTTIVGGLAGVIVDGVGADITTAKGVLIEPQRTNLFLTPEAPVTQTVPVVSGTKYTVSIKGTGSVVLSDAGAGTVIEGSDVTITAGSTSLVCTVSGTVDLAQVESGIFSTSFIFGGTRLPDLLEYNVSAGFPQSFVIEMDVTPVADGADYTWNEFIFFGTEDSRGSSYEIMVRGDNFSYGTGSLTSGIVAYIDKADLSKGVKAHWSFSFTGEASGARIIIKKDNIEKLNVWKAGAFDHSNTGNIAIGSHGGNVASANIKNIIIK